MFVQHNSEAERDSVVMMEHLTLRDVIHAELLHVAL